MKIAARNITFAQNVQKTATNLSKKRLLPNNFVIIILVETFLLKKRFAESELEKKKKEDMFVQELKQLSERKRSKLNFSMQKRL